MSNTIKLKRGSGSDPSASDLVVGELAIRTDSGKIFTKKDNGNVAEISGGGISDGDKGDITVSNSGDTFTIDNDVVTFAKMQNISSDIIMGRISSGSGNPEDLNAAQVRTILNVENGATADQSASEILTLLKTVDGAGSGLDADTVDGIASGSFLRGDVDDTTVGHLTFNRSSDAKFSLQGSSNPYFNLREGTTNKARFQWNESGYIWIQNFEDDSVLLIRDNLGFSPDAGSTIHSIFHAGNLSVGDGGLTQKNFTTTLKNKLDGIAASATNNGSGNAITDGDKGDITVSSSGGTFTIDNDVVTTAKMINFPTGTLLGRSSAGTGNATTLTASEVRSLLNVENGATADQSASEILTLIKTVDGSGSGLDADLLDGVSSGSFVRSDANDSITGHLTITNDSGLKVRSSTNGAGAVINFSDHAGGSYAQNGSLTYKHSDGTVTTTGGNSNDGWLFEGSEPRTVVKVVGDLEATQDIYGGTLVLNDSDNQKIILQGSNDPYIRWREGTTNKAFIQWSSSGYLWLQNQEDNSVIVLRDNLGFSPDGGSTIHKIFHAGNDGAGSGLDADLLDGVQGSNYVRTNQNTTITSDLFIGGGAGGLTVNAASDIRFANGDWTGNVNGTAKIQHHSNYLYISGGTNGIIFRENSDDRWIIDPSGHFDPGADSSYDIGASDKRVRNGYFDNLYGSGANITNVNATTLDSIDSGSFLRSDTDDTFSAVLTLSSTSRDCMNFSGGAGDDNRGIAFNGRIALSADQNDGYLRLNNASEFGNGVYTPGVIRADNGFQVDGTTVINGSGNYTRALSSASDYSTLLRSNAADVMSQGTQGTATLDVRNTGGIGSGTGTGALIARFKGDSDGIDIRNISGGDYGIYNNQQNNGFELYDGTGGVKILYAGNIGVEFDSGNTYGDFKGRPSVNGTGLALVTEIGGGATGGGSDEVFYENDQTVTTNYTITNGKNAMAAGPITINSGVTVTVGSGETLTIV